MQPVFVESDSDEDNDAAAAECKRRRTEQHAESSASLQAAVRARARPFSANRRSKSPVSPSAQWEGTPSPYATEPPLLLEGSALANSAIMVEIDGLKHHFAYLGNEVAKLTDLVKGQQDLLVHLCEQLAFHYKQPQFTSKMPRVYDPLQHKRPCPGPKEEAPARGLEPLELGVLRRKIYEISNSWPAKREGFRRIVDEVKWSSSERIRINLDTLDKKKQWKLWHYAFNPGASLQTVLTQGEMAASAAGKGPKTSCSGLRPPISSELYERSERTVMAAACGVQAVAAVSQSEATAAAAAASSTTENLFDERA